MKVGALLLVVAVDVGDSSFFLGPSGKKVLIKFSRVIEASMVTPDGQSVFTLSSFSSQGHITYLRLAYLRTACFFDCSSFIPRNL